MKVMLQHDFNSSTVWLHLLVWLVVKLLRKKKISSHQFVSTIFLGAERVGNLLWFLNVLNLQHIFLLLKTVFYPVSEDIYLHDIANNLRLTSVFIDFGSNNAFSKSIVHIELVSWGSFSLKSQWECVGTLLLILEFE